MGPDGLAAAITTDREQRWRNSDDKRKYDPIFLKIKSLIENKKGLYS